jgi:hypothetical protein
VKRHHVPVPGVERRSAIGENGKPNSGLPRGGRMKAALAASLALVLPSLAVAADASPPVPKSNVCFDVSDIDRSVILSDQEIVFYLKGGKAWKNTLQGTCPGLHSQQGFRWRISTTTVCANQQILYAMHSQKPCFLGNFTPYTEQKPH